MLSDLDNVLVLPLNKSNPDRDMVFKSNYYESIGYSAIRLGNFGHNFYSENIRYDHSFYNQAQVDFKERWDSFYIPSHKEREENVYQFYNEKYDLDNKKYVFLHEDTNRGFSIERSHIDNKYIIVSPVSNGIGLENKFRFCDYRKIIQNASEIHCIESSFCAMIEGLNIGKNRNAHRYCRPEASGSFFLEFTYRNNWSIIT